MTDKHEEKSPSCCCFDCGSEYWKGEKATDTLGWLFLDTTQPHQDYHG